MRRITMTLTVLLLAATLFIFVGCGKGQEGSNSHGGEDSSYNPPPRSDAWGVVVATSEGWDNYRHQSDALAVYDLLKKNGMADDHIILMMVDDIKDDPHNPEKGVVRNQVEGTNLRDGAQVDYSGEAVTANNLALALLGIEGISGPVIGSGTGSDVLVYMVGHGEGGSLTFAYGPGFGADALSTVVERMFESQRYGRLLIVAETCDAADLGSSLDIPGALFFGACSHGETSKAINYDQSLDTWLADQFSYIFWETASKNSKMPLSNFLSTVHDGVSDSQTVVLNSDNFGSLSSVSVVDFLAP